MGAAGLWGAAAHALGGDLAVALADGAALEERYAEPHRHYHRVEHVLAVQRDALSLVPELPVADRDVLTLAALVHDVVYDGQPGDDERRSAEWAVARLRACGVDAAAAARVSDAVLATAAHEVAGDDPVVPLLLDADLAVLAATRASYDAYVAAVRLEYSAYDDAAWSAGRAAVLRSLADRDVLYVAPAARDRWDAPARANLARELAALVAGA